MLRHSTPLETLLTYATFLAISVAVHMVVILGTRSQEADRAKATPAASKKTEKQSSSKTNKTKTVEKTTKTASEGPGQGDLGKDAGRIE